VTDQNPGQDELPLLTFELAAQIGEFPEFAYTVDVTDVESYRRATGLPEGPSTGFVPPGYAAIFGRLGYLREHRMPGGGVLLGQEIEWLAPARLGEPMMIQSVVERAEEDDRGRRKIVFTTTARQSGRRVAVVRIIAGWPA
jgi:hypothetical protein